MNLKERIADLKRKHSLNKIDLKIDSDEIMALERKYEKDSESLLYKMVNRQIKRNDEDLSEISKKHPELMNAYKENLLYSSLTKLRITPLTPFAEKDDEFLYYYYSSGKIKMLSSMDTMAFWTKLQSFLKKTPLKPKDPRINS